MQATRQADVPGWPKAALSLTALQARDAAELGVEAQQLVALREAGVPVVEAVVVGAAGEDAEAGVLDAVRRAFERGAGAVTLRPLFANDRFRERFARFAMPRVVRGPAAAEAAVKALFADLQAQELMGALGGSAARLRILLELGDSEQRGGAASVDPVTGDPETLVAWTEAAAPWYVDRRTARVVRSGEGALDESVASHVADLVDRAQLALQVPVQIEWVPVAGRWVVASVRPLHIAPSFAGAPYRILTLVAPDEGTVAPLAIDALDRAMSRDDDPSDEPRVRRIYGRPYRRQDESDRHRRATAETSLARVALRAAQVAKDVALPLAAVRQFERALEAQLRAFDACPLESLDDAALGRELFERHRLAVEAFVLLDRHRLSTIAVLGALELAGCALPRETFPAIARPRTTKARRRQVDRLRRLALAIEEEAGDLVVGDRLSRGLAARVADLRGELRHERPFGIDVCPDAIGASDENFLAALRLAQRADEDAQRRARRTEVRRIRQSAAAGPFGRTREGLASSLIFLQSRVSRSKGVAVEGLAAVLLRVRRAAVVAGARLVDAGVLDEPTDALYLHLAEIEEALRGEPGAYASRVRLRREDDARWARYEAPRRIEARRPHG